jgi:hypothetical protein
MTAVPADFQHAQAFAETSSALAKALEELGHESVETQNTFVPGAFHIVLGAHLLAAGTALPPQSAVFNLEQIEEDSPFLGGGYLELLRRSRVWDYSAANVRKLRELGVERVRHVPLGYHETLTRIAPAHEDIDVLFYGSLNERRLAVLRALRDRGHNVAPVFGAYGGERDALIARARIVLNLHHYEAKVFEIVRVSYLLANRRCVVSETGAIPEEEAEFRAGVAFAPYDGLVQCCERLLAAPQERMQLAGNGFEIMRARRQATFLAPALAALAGEA